MFKTLLIVRYFFQNRLHFLWFGIQILFEHVQTFQAAIIEVHLLIFRIVVLIFLCCIKLKISCTNFRFKFLQCSMVCTNHHQCTIYKYLCISSFKLAEFILAILFYHYMVEHNNLDHSALRLPST